MPYQSPTFAGQFQGATGDQLVFTGPASNQQLMLEGIDMVPSAGVAIAWTLSYFEGGTKFYGAALDITEVLRPFQWRGCFPLIPGDEIWIHVAGGSVDVLGWGYFLAHPLPMIPL